jgi:hypothetical protein
MKFTSTTLVLAVSAALASAAPLAASAQSEGNFNPVSSQESALGRREKTGHRENFVTFRDIFEQHGGHLLAEMRRRDMFSDMGQIEEHPCFNESKEKCFNLWSDAVEARDKACESGELDKNVLQTMADKCVLFKIAPDCLLEILD